MSDFDHTSIAVRDAPRHLAWLRRHLGATPLLGQVLPGFRYVLSHLGDARAGARLELMDAAGPPGPRHGPGFLRHFLDRHGEGPHHLTFTVPDVGHAIERVERLGLTVVNTDLAHPPWRETFIRPDEVHGVVIQLADTSVGYPPTAELLATRDRDPTRLPGNREGRDPHWWTAAWQVPPGPVAYLRSTTLRSTDPALSHRLFAEVLGGEVLGGEGGEPVYRWPGGVLVVRPARTPGVDRLTLAGGPGDFHIGTARFTQEET
ncbi:VOC family protein [Nonomuraea sp. NPDC048916]|uniref:VOC family protein n=1 Tax=Nonomuraea sp. NPDC048916 TaxID=3154232 RepID=UPI0033EABC6B